MTDFTVIETTESPYLYVERSASMDPAEIGPAMGSAFGEVWAFMQKHGVAPAGPALAVYTSYAPDKMDFRAGFFIAPEDMAAAESPVMADVTPAGRAVKGTHHGSYATIRDSYGEMHAFTTAEGLDFIAPTWEVYLNDPSTTPEDQLLTEMYQAIKG